MNIDKEIQELQKQIDALKVKAEQCGEFKDGDKYWVIGSEGAAYERYWTNDSLVQARLAYGNVFKTKEEAIKHRDQRLAEVKVLRKLRELEGDWVADWSDDSQSKYCAYYCYMQKRVELNFFNYRQKAKTDWYSSQEAWQWVITNMADDVKLMLGVE